MAKKLLAVSSVTLIKISDGSPGEPGIPGPPGEVKDFYDGSFSEGKRFWTTMYNNNVQHGSSVEIINSTEAVYGAKLFKATGETWGYAKNHIPIENNKIYKFTYRVKQLTNPTNGSDKNKVYAGATTFDANGNKLCQNNGEYFIVGSYAMDTSKGWMEFVAYMSSTAKAAIIDGSNTVLCPQVKAFNAGTKTIKPMFLVNYSGGNGVAVVDGLIIEDFTQEWNALYALKDKLNNDAQDVFDALTDGGKKQGIIMDENGDLWINGKFINARNLTVKDKNNNLTLGIDDVGNVSINASSLKISSKPAASTDDVNTAIDGIQVGARNYVLGTKEGKIITGTNASNQTVNVGYFSVPEDLKGKTVTTTFKYQITSATVSGTLKLQTADAAYYSLTDTITLKLGDVVSVKKTVKLGTDDITYVSARFDNFVGSIDFYELKVELGSKSTGYSESPEDIEEAIKKAQTTADGKLTKEQLEVFNTLTNNGAEQGIYLENGLLYLNAKYIRTGQIDAKYINTRTLNVVNDDNLVTFGVSTDGDVTIHGTIQSTKFNADTSYYGYKLTPEGDAIFKNATIGGEFITPEGGISNYGSKNNSKNLIQVSQMGYRDSTGTYDKKKNTWTITAVSGTGATWGAGLVVGGKTTVVPHNSIYICSFEIKVPVDCNWNVDVNNAPVSGSAWSGNDNDSNRTSSEKSLKANVWTKCWFKYKNGHSGNTGKVSLYDISNFGVINNSGKNIVYEIRNIKGEIGSEPTPWIPHESDKFDLVRFWAGADYEERTNAPFIVYSDGSIKATKGEFSGVFSGEISIGNIHIEDTSTSKGAIEIKDNNDSTTLIRLNEDSSYFKNNLDIGTNFINFDSSSKILTNKGKLSLQNGNMSTIMNNGTYILTSSDSSAKHHQYYSSGGYCFKSEGSKTRVQDYIFWRSNDEAVRMDIWGHLEVRDKFTMPGSKITMVPRNTSGNSGFDFVVN